jgi:hypothetical protein
MPSHPQPVKSSPQVGTIAHQWANGGPLFRAIIVFAGIFLLVLIAQVTRVASNAPLTSTTASPTQAPSYSSPTLSWHPVKTFSGLVQKKTESFTIKGREWRISWETKGSGHFGLFVHGEDGRPLDLVANIIGSGSETTIMRGAGTYYLDITTSQPYTIKVEDYY